MARYPKAEWRGPIPNVGGKMAAYRLGVFHVMQGTLAGTDSWFRDPASQVSAHFGVGTDGTVVQWVDTADVAWAEAEYNDVAISIEHEGFSGQALSTAQIEADVDLIRWLDETHGKFGWLGHGELGVAGGDHPDCPGQPILDQIPAIITGARDNPQPRPEVTTDMNNPTFVRWAYLEYLLREPDPDGLKTWVDFLDAGGDRGNMIAQFVDGPEGRNVLVAKRRALGL